MKYVAYGSNMNLEQMAVRCPGARLIGTGLLRGYQLEFNRHATIVPTNNPDAAVPVAVWEITAQHEYRLDNYEGFPRYYRKLSCTVDLSEGEHIQGMVYQMCSFDYFPPNEAYFAGMYSTAKAYDMNMDFKVLVNPTGRFVIGSSFADTGVTGRKIIADTYGGACRHGGGAFSGKDPTKVDRSGAYMARKIAKDILRAGYAKRCEVQLAYAIGRAEPVSVSVDCFGTSLLPQSFLVRWIRKHYDLSPAGIISSLKLLDVDYNLVSSYGHFWRAGLPWEQ